MSEEHAMRLLYPVEQGAEDDIWAYDAEVTGGWENVMQSTKICMAHQI
jgi:hypothetical protein